jgi:hypothetical protein
MRTPFQDFAWEPLRLDAWKVLGWMLLILGLISGGRLVAQGVVNVNNRGLNPPQLVVTQDGTPLTGTQWVAQIVYGPDAGSLTNKLGDPMPFRVSTTAFPGTWIPWANGIRTLVGFVEGQTVFMQVYVWNTALYSGLEEARGGWDLWTCRISGPSFGASGAFTYRVGSASDPSSLQLVNFRSIILLNSSIWPDAYVDDELGGRWLRVVETTEDTPSVTVDLMAIPPQTGFLIPPPLPVEFPPDTTGDEPLGSAVRRVTTGNPMSLTGPSTGGLPQVVVAGSTESVTLDPGQSSAETSLVSVEGTVGQATLRLKRPFIGRVELEMRYPLQDPPISGGCRSFPRRIVLDVKPSRTPTRVSLSSGARPSLKLRLESGRSHALQRSYDLASWQTMADYRVGFPMCYRETPPGFCGAMMDPDDVSRFADFEFPLGTWHSRNDSRPVFFRVRSQ